MASLAKLPVRAFVGFLHAGTRDLDRFCYLVTLGAWGVPAGLSFRLKRYLAAFGVLIRSGEYGYRGIRAPIWAISRFVGNVSQGAASEATTRRALKEAAAGGWIVLSYYGGGKPRELVNVQGEAFTVRDQVPVVTFTEKLWKIFERRGPTSDYRGPTSDYGLQNARVSICPIDSPPGKSQKKARARAGVVVDVDLEGSEAVTVARAPVALDCDTGSPPVNRPSGSHPSGAGKPGGKGSKTRAKSGRSAPRDLHGARPFVRGQAARDLLSVLVYVAHQHGRAGHAACARAALELSDPAAAAGSVVAWDFWLARWGSLSRTEKRSALRREVLPGLLAQGGAVVVGLPTRCAATSPPGGDSDRGAATSPPGGDSDRGDQVPGDQVPGDPVDLVAIFRESAAAGNEFARAWLLGRGLE